jgi:hypothetical protein
MGIARDNVLLAGGPAAQGCETHAYTEAARGTAVRPLVTDGSRLVARIRRVVGEIGRVGADRSPSRSPGHQPSTEEM